MQKNAKPSGTNFFLQIELFTDCGVPRYAREVNNLKMWEKDKPDYNTVTPLASASVLNFSGSLSSLIIISISVNLA